METLSTTSGPSIGKAPLFTGEPSSVTIDIDTAAGRPSPAEPTAEAVMNEIRALAAAYPIDPATIERSLGCLAPHLSRYAEICLAEHGFEVLTGGRDARALAAIAGSHGASGAAIDAFHACDSAFPQRMLGLKVGYGLIGNGPTLYVRTHASTEECLSFLARTSRVSALAAALAKHGKVYGLAFFDAPGGDLAVKVYVIDHVRADLAENGESSAAAALGFVSYRLIGGRAETEVKRYLLDVPWDQINAPGSRWPGLVDFARARFGRDRASYFGRLERPGAPPEIKLYVERIGAIPTDLAVR